ncbi:MAG: hypothetical protein ACR2OZ_18305 [Verrucomicrobiales bacterium]
MRLAKGAKAAAIPTTAGLTYKTCAGDQPWRKFIDPEQTLRQWKARFSTGDVFRHSSEVCEQWLVPEGETLENMPAFWAAHRLTGDNSKERPYANIYPHLTTRSNTFEVHCVAQEIRKSPNSLHDVFDPVDDEIVNETQGRAFVHSQIDPTIPDIPDYAGIVSGGGTISADQSLANFRGTFATYVDAALEAPEIINIMLDTDGLHLRMSGNWQRACLTH